ncbi:hypothetical protein PYH37_003678 [Sinorhizobium numidicum]|uniref:Uncharacterized protein n=1 Tax=Sinorhizobium numidicum TaxID=680248 RepID=A0ABY8CW59_9HYPH|nr:hypothetical protein [Sinorhizobium numidicum]WEX78755.1 hypothetical protein PYH37_003678 [Sinorhizobium numidicum]WEX82152.1 hypothetical protein PYH38_004391 [Sinorhizobium numidicum]
MKAALIVMTILGCDDNVSQCHYISTVNGSWPSIAQCDTESQQELPKFSNKNYPVVVAVCESSGPGMTASTERQPEANPVPQQSAVLPPAEETNPGLPKRALALLSGAVPDREKLKAIVSAPVHYVEDGYSWVARRFAE